MNFPSVVCILAAHVGVMVALLGLGFGSAPGWGRYRALAGVGLTAAVYSTLDALWTSHVSTEVRFALAGAQGGVTALQVIAWQAYVSAHLRLPKTSFDRVGTVALAVIAALWLVPGLMVSHALAVVVVPAVGVTYRLPGSTLAGSAAGAVETLFLGLQLLRYVRARRDNPDAWTHILALGAIFVCGVNDSLVWCEKLRSPLLLSLGFLVAVGALGSSLARAFVASARQVDHLSRSLERLVAERTEALVAAEAALFRTEKMAALGQLAAGVAHEINNPAAAIEANLAYLRDGIDTGQLPTDARECVDESLQAIARITRIVLQLLDSGRAAARARNGNGSASVRAAVNEALA